MLSSISMPNLGGSMMASGNSPTKPGHIGEHVMKHSPSNLDKIGSQILQSDNADHYNSFGSPSRAPVPQLSYLSGQATPKGANG